MEKVEIIYQDEEVMVVNKPAGIITTNENQKLKVQSPKWKSLEEWVKEHFPNKLPRQGIVHRLDKGTSGLVVIAKNETSLKEWKKRFGERRVQKKYWAVVGGDTSRDGAINMPIGRSKYSFGRFAVDEEGKMAVTEFKRIGKLTIGGKIFSLLEINLKTGRTHQIRVHLSYLGWPLLGDKTYGGQSVDGLDRPFLHAYYLKWADREIMIDLPADLQQILDKYGH